MGATMILITGASGVIGRALSDYLTHLDIGHVGLISDKKIESELKVLADGWISGRFDHKTDWSQVLSGITHVIHCASCSGKPSAELYSQEMRALGNFLSYIKASKVECFLYLSSIKAAREFTSKNQWVDVKTIPNPISAYGRLKLSSEMLIVRELQDSKTAYVIVRPAAVLAPQKKGNFALLARLVLSGVPLPFKTINNKRALLGIDNLVDFLVTCIKNPKARYKTLAVSDGADLSTPEILEEIACAVDRPLRLFGFPVKLIVLFARLVGKEYLGNSLCNDLRIDPKFVASELGWLPKTSTREGVRKMLMTGDGSDTLF